jgi:HEAT repeat protein
MRKLIVASVLGLSMLAAPACKEPDPNRWETHTERIKDPDKRATGFTGLERLVKTVATAKKNDDLKQEFADKVVPVFDEMWDEAAEQQETMLTMLLDIGHPAGSAVWNKALVLDGSSESRKKTILALQGIKKARATDSLDAVLAELDKLVADPKNDKSEPEGEVRALMVETLGVLGDKKALPTLVKVLQQTGETQPVGVHREAADAIARIGVADEAAIDALVTVQYRVPDAATSRNIGERAKSALAALGEASVPKVLEMFRGDHAEVQKLAAQHGLSQINIQMAGASMLSAIGSPKAVDELMAFFPTGECTAPAEEKKKEEPAKEGEEEEQEIPEVSEGDIRAVVASALGFIGDPKAAEKLCVCAKKSKNPGDMFPIAEALGRMGGPKAVECLVDVVKTAEYDPELVTNSEFKYEIRWEGARFAVMAATIDEMPAVKDAIAAANAADPKTAEHTKAWEPGIAVVEECKKDKDCYLGKVKNSNADWFAREKAAVELARLAPGDKAAAFEIAKAYKVRDPSARVTMAWLPAKMMAGAKCQDCADEYERIMNSEKDSRLDATYQLSVLTARYTIPKLREPGAASVAAEGGGEAKAE